MVGVEPVPGGHPAVVVLQHPVQAAYVVRDNLGRPARRGIRQLQLVGVVLGLQAGVLTDRVEAMEAADNTRNRGVETCMQGLACSVQVCV